MSVKCVCFDTGVCVLQEGPSSDSDRHQTGNCLDRSRGQAWRAGNVSYNENTKTLAKVSQSLPVLRRWLTNRWVR